MSKEWDNEERRRYYGKRVGDIVEFTAGYPARLEQAEVVGYGGGDNNRIYLKYSDGHIGGTTAERCKVVVRVEDRGIEDIKDWIEP